MTNNLHLHPFSQYLFFTCQPHYLLLFKDGILVLLILKGNEMHSFSNLFDKVLYIFRTVPLSIIRNISTLYRSNRYLSCYFCWLSASAVRSTLPGNQQKKHDKYLLRVYSVEILLMMESGTVRKM